MKLSLTTLFSVLLVSFYASPSVVVDASPAPAVPSSSNCYKCPSFDNNSPTPRPLSSQTTIANGAKYHCVYSGGGPGQHTCDYSVTTGAGVPGNNADCPNNASTTTCDTKGRRRRGGVPQRKQPGGGVKKPKTTDERLAEAMDRLRGTTGTI